MVGVAALACGVAVFWGMARAPVEPYYAAAAHAMARSPHNFFFAAADWDGTVSIDKLPGGVWPSALSCAVFGTRTWSIVLPYALAAVGAVIALYFPIRTLAGPAAGAAASAALAVSPVLICLGRGNIPDTFLVLLLVLALGDTVSAARRGSLVRLVRAGMWLGLAFEVKMLAAWLVLPALAIGFVLLAELPRRKIATGLAAAGGATLVVSLAWPVIVDLLPRGGRPYVDGTVDDSVLSQTFQYNGFGRTGTATPNQMLQQQGLPLTIPAGEPGPLRLLTGSMGRESAWLLALCLLIVIAGSIARRGGPRSDPFRAGYALFGVWVITYYVVFSTMPEINPYYVVAAAPALAGIVGLGFAQARRCASPWAARLAVVAAAVGAGSGLLIAYGGDAWVPRALLPVTGAALAITVIVFAAERAGSQRLLICALVAALTPAAAAALTVPLRGEGAVDVPLESRQSRARLAATFRDTVDQASGLIPVLRAGQHGAPDLVATQSAALGSIFAMHVDAEVYPIGGFDGLGAVPTLDQLKRDVAAGRFHVVIGLARTTDPRMQWIARACRAERSGSTLITVHACAPKSAAVP